MTKDQIHQVVAAALTSLHFPTDTLSITPPNNESFGDYSTSIALQLAKKEKKPPMELAQQIADAIKPNDLIAGVEVMKPGFVNISLAKKYLLENILTIDKTYGENKLNSEKKITLEFTDPNPFKEMHIGHLYSNTIGESLSRLLGATGAHIRRVCYQGDVGMHVAKSIWGMQKKMKDENISLDTLEKQELGTRIKFLGQAYSMGATAYEENETNMQEIKDINYLVYASAQNVLKETVNWEPQVDYQQYVKSSEVDQSEIKDLFEKGRSWSLEYFESIYARLGTSFDSYYFESIVGEYGIQIVKEYLKKGIFEKSDGAIIFPGDTYGLHARVFINSLGLPTYEAKELGLAPTKYKDFPYDLSIIVTGNEINAYFKVLLMALQKTRPDLAVKTKHIGHGMVRLPEGKMSSRTGKVLTAEWLLDEVKRHIIDMMKSSDQVSVDEIEGVSEKLAVAAIKYSFLRGNIGNDTKFDFDESLSLVGNSGPYLVYTYVRCKSVLNRHSEQSEESRTNMDPSVTPFLQDDNTLNEEELTLLRTLSKYPEVVTEAAKNFAPNYVCTYLYDLGQKYNLFYQKHQILNAQTEEEQNLRLSITQAVAHVLKNGLNLLGIETVEKM